MTSILEPEQDDRWDRAAALRDERCCTECGSRTPTVMFFVGDERHDMHRICGFCAGQLATRYLALRATVTP